MVAFARASADRVNAFRIRERYLFKQYFDEQAIFDRLRRYYEASEYRFAVPADEYEEIQAFLREFDYALVEVDAIEEFVVVVEKYTAHPENIFKDAVHHTGTTDHNVFLLKDREAVEQAVLNGATRITETDIAVPF